MPPATAPTAEIGYATVARTSGGVNWIADEEEPTPELRWPRSIEVYDDMRRDAQIVSVLNAVTMPVRRTPWRVKPDGARDEVVELVAGDLGLPIVGREGADPPRPVRRRDRFSFQEHLRLALLMLPFGHMFFEQIYRIDADPDGQLRAHLRKLGPRMPRSIASIDVAADGGLISISQWPYQSDASVPIKANRLVAYVHEREGGNWFGRSMLRPAYKHWLIKDRLLRVQAQAIERNGMGIPVYEAQEEASDEDLEAGKAMATGMRAGETAGAATPHGARIRLVTPEGAVLDPQRAIDYHDQQIARMALGHFMTLGGQTGSWALGSVFADFFTLSLQTVADQVADVGTQHVVEDLVDVNFGPDEPAPCLIHDEIGSRHEATAEAIRALLQAGALRWDPALEQQLRIAYGLPPASEDTPPPERAPNNPAADPNNADGGGPGAR